MCDGTLWGKRDRKQSERKREATEEGAREPKERREVPTAMESRNPRTLTVFGSRRPDGTVVKLIVHQTNVK